MRISSVLFSQYLPQSKPLTAQLNRVETPLPVVSGEGDVFFAGKKPKRGFVRDRVTLRTGREASLKKTEQVRDTLRMLMTRDGETRFILQELLNKLYEPIHPLDDDVVDSLIRLELLDEMGEIPPDISDILEASFYSPAELCAQKSADLWSRQSLEEYGEEYSEDYEGEEDEDDEPALEDFGMGEVPYFLQNREVAWVEDPYLTDAQGYLSWRQALAQHEPEVMVLAEALESKGERGIQAMQLMVTFGVTGAMALKAAQILARRNVDVLVEKVLAPEFRQFAAQLSLVESKGATGPRKFTL